MLTLTDNLINEIEINGFVFKLNMSFDNIIRIDQIQNDLSLSDAEQLAMGYRLLFIDPPAIGEAKLYEAFIKAYTEVCLRKNEKQIVYDLAGNPMPDINQDGEEDEGPVYDLTQDAEYIFSSFMMDYSINLIKQRGKLHWHEFQALLGGLSEETMFSKVIRIRREPLPKNGKEREQAQKLKKQFALKRKTIQD